MNQAQANTQITRLSQMDSTQLPTQVVATVNRQLTAAADHLAELAHIIETVIAQTAQEGDEPNNSATHNNHTDGHVQATPTDLSDLPAEPISIIVAASDVNTIGRFKSTARHFTNAVRPIVRRLRLPKAIERAGVGGVVQFDDQLSHGDVMKGMWMVEEGDEGGWGEVADTLRVAEHCGNCQLPVTVGAGDLHTHATKAQDGTLQLLRHNNNELRAIRNEPNFAITINPPLPLLSRPVHPFSQHPFTHHAKPHDPPASSRIVWQNGVGWATVGVNDGHAFASASSMLKDLMLGHRLLVVGGFTYSPTVVVDRRVRGGHLERIMTQSPHTPLNGCSDVVAFEVASGWCGQQHLLTSFNDPFIAWIFFVIPLGNNQDVHVTVSTTEAPAVGVPHDARFAQRFPRTAAKARRVLGPTAAIVLDGQAP
ncbi:unnamed protein product [Vitrella brassicaformis CCMP3155]|uniref:Uncharacterized protein n=1 Tax=Vitrella brassicaformis (strain CCMP3155) TaxID=1169540 RepID=A0A0G4FQ11_VITBC|nr:unnamed protein product [Vitrella brassicaformis CCMP3155]|eukprot:CEM15902.1 unnamed protein product [Vitrella brassicaformis CCMP3155]